MRITITGRTMMAAAVMAVCANVQGADAKSVVGKVEKVTLYRGQAMVTRVVPVEGAKGSVELVISELPQHVVGSSLFAEGDESVQVRAVRYRTRAVGQEPREEVRKLDVKIEALIEEIQNTQQLKQLATQRNAYLDKLEGFIAPTSKVELSKGVLNAETLETLTKFTFAQRLDAAKQALDAARTEKKLGRDLNLLQRQRAKITGSATRETREAVLFLEKRGAGKATVRLNYVVNGCGWNPAYNFRADSKTGKVRAEYNAVVQQMSGEDWGNVELTLSTASPALSAKGPGLAPFRVVLRAAVISPKSPQTRASSSQLAQQLKQISGRQIEANLDQRNATNYRDNLKGAWRINAAANEFQSLELNQNDVQIFNDKIGGLAQTEGPSLNYQLEQPVSIASRSDQQIVQIMQSTLDAKLYYVATPVLTSFVYREAEISNTSSKDLLGGNVIVYLDGRFVGRSEIGTVARGQKFVLGFGADPQLRTRRELVKKDDRVQGGNREFAFEYRLTVENYKDAALPVRLYDRLPKSDRDAEVRITLEEKTDKLSKNAFYVRRERPMGILRWDIEVPAKAAGEDARVVEYEYKLEFDRKLVLSSPTLGGAAPAEELQQFDVLERQRFFNH